MKRRTYPRSRNRLAGALARKANKRHTWIECLNVNCGPGEVTCEPPDPEDETASLCCRANFQVVLVDNAVIQGQASNVVGFSDACTVVALRGYITLLATPDYGQDPLINYLELASTGVVGTMGLRKSDVTANNPFGDEYGLLDAPDYTESKQRRTWEHHQWPLPSPINLRGSITGGGQSTPVAVPKFDSFALGPQAGGVPIGGIGASPGAASFGSQLTGVLAPTTDAITLGADVQCFTCGQFTDDGIAQDYTQTARAPSPWKWDLTSKKRFALRENEQLALHLSLSTFNASGVGPGQLPWKFSWMARCKALLEF